MERSGSVATLPGLAGAVVLVTGGSRGIGEAIALAAAAQGADVAIGFRERASEASAVAERVRAAGARALAVQADVSDRAAVDSMVAEVVGALGRLDALVNNAARLGARREFAALSPAEWSAEIEANLTGVFHCTQAVLPPMLRQGGGRIVNVVSRLAQVGGAGLAAYSAAKAGVIGLTRALAHELGPKGIRVNAVAPGVVATRDRPPLSEAQRAAKLAELPLGRFAEPEEIAHTVLFLLSDWGGQYAGQTLNPNGGGYMA